MNYSPAFYYTGKGNTQVHTVSKRQSSKNIYEIFQALKIKSMPSVSTLMVFFIYVLLPYFRENNMQFFVFS